MIAVLADWALVSAAGALLMVGLGLGVERLAGRTLPAALLLPLGLAAAIVVAQLAQGIGASGSVAAMVWLLLAVAGFAVAWRSGRSRRANLWGVGAVFLVWFVYAGAIAFTGQATFGGYGQLADTAIHLVGADLLPGRPTAAELGTGSFGALYDGYYLTGYPTGGAATLGTLDTLLGRGAVETIQPLMALIMAALAASAWTILTPLVPVRWQRAAVSVLVAIPVLSFSFVLQGSFKEILAMALLAASCAALPRRAPGDDALRARALARTAIPGGLVAAALIACIGPAGIVYLGPVALIGGLLYWREGSLRAATLVVGAALAIALALSISTLLELRSYLEVSGVVLTTQAEVGNLLRPVMPIEQLFGVWLAPEFRLRAGHVTLTELGAWIVAALVAVGIVSALVRRPRGNHAAALAWIGATAIGTLIVVRSGSPWADAKALAIAGPAVIAAAGIGLAALWERRLLRVPALALAGCGALAIVGSAAYVSHDVAPAPAARFAELESINTRYAGQGLMIGAEFEEFTRYLLRDVPATFSSDPLKNLPGSFKFGLSGDSDDFEQATVATAKLILVRSGPAISRPPSNFVRSWRGRFYEVWRADPALPKPRMHVALGDRTTGGVALPDCKGLRAFAGGAAADEQLVAALRAEPATQPYEDLPPRWYPDDDGRYVHPTSAGRTEFTLAAPASSQVDVWLEGGFTRKIQLTANGRTGSVGPVASNPRFSATRVLSTRADADGQVRIVLERPGSSLRPGTGNLHALLGPVSVTPQDPLKQAQVVRLAPKDAAELCGKSVDWIELAARR